jgi:hypothetical protein
MDTAPTPSPVATTTADPKVSQLISDVGVTASDIKSAVAAYKAGGLPAVAALSPTLIPHVQAIVSDVQAAVPAIKAGYKTTEFWLVAAFGVANAVVPLVTGKPLPFNVDASLAAVLSVYTVVRAIIKKPATAGA